MRNFSLAARVAPGSFPRARNRALLRASGRTRIMRTSPVAAAKRLGNARKAKVAAPAATPP